VWTTILLVVVGAPVALLMLLRLITAMGALSGHLAGDDRFHELSKRRTAANAHITVYWCFQAAEERFATMAAEARQRFWDWVAKQPHLPVQEGATKDVFATADAQIDPAIEDRHEAMLKATSGLLNTNLPVQLITFPKPGALAMTLDHTMVSGLTFARSMAYTLGDPENKGSRAFPVAWYFPIVSELALLWYMGRVAWSMAGWKALPSHPENAGVSPDTVYYDFNIQSLKTDAMQGQPGTPPSTLALIAAHTMRGLLRSMRGGLDRPLRVGFSVAFAHSKILHNNVGLIVIDVPATGADMTLPELAVLITRRVGKEKLQAWHANNFLKTIPSLPSTSYRSGVDVVFTTYPSPPADLFEPTELSAVKVEVREITYPIYVNCISYLERSFVSLVVNTPMVDVALLRAEHSQGAAAQSGEESMAPKDADAYRELFGL
jgi:hypothetical protein